MRNYPFCHIYFSTATVVSVSQEVIFAQNINARNFSVYKYVQILLIYIII